jgi:sensor histidine kinase YesM
MFVILVGGIGLLAFYNHRSVERILQNVRTAELKRVRLERQLVESRLATAQAHIDPRALFESLARIRNLYASSQPQADRELENLIEKLRSRHAAVGIASVAVGPGP